MTDQDARKLQAIIAIILDTVREAGPLGAPSGPMYAALNAHGCTLQFYQMLMASLCQHGKLRLEHDCYSIA